MSEIENGAPRWRKSSYSLENGCVEMARRGDFVLIRDSKDPSGPILTVTPEAWDRFVAGVKNNGFS